MGTQLCATTNVIKGDQAQRRRFIYKPPESGVGLGAFGGGRYFFVEVPVWGQVRGRLPYSTRIVTDHHSLSFLVSCIAFVMDSLWPSWLSLRFFRAALRVPTPRGLFEKDSTFSHFIKCTITGCMSSRLVLSNSFTWCAQLHALHVRVVTSSV